MPKNVIFLPKKRITDLGETLLTSPHRGVNDLEEELPSSWIEDKDGTVDGLRREISLEGFVNCDTVDVRVVDEPEKS